MTGPRGYPESVLVSYATKGKANAFSVPASKQVYIYNARSFNNSGGSINVGICRSHIASQYHIWTLTTGGTVYTDSSAAIAAGTATNIFTTVNNDGFIVTDSRRFNLLQVTVSSASGGGTYTYKYWNGSAYTTLTTLEVPVYSATGDIWIVFQAPSDWVVGGPASVSQTQYSIQVIATTHPTTAVAITSAVVGEFLEFYEAVPNASAIQLSFPDSKPVLLNGGEGLFPYFATAAAANQFGCFYTTV